MATTPIQQPSEDHPAWQKVSNEFVNMLNHTDMTPKNAVRRAAEKAYALGCSDGIKEGFETGIQRARDALATLASESEALARGQAAEAEQAQTRAAASATRAAVQRGGVALLDREIAALKGGA